MPEIITRAEAKARGLNRYFTNIPCQNGHLSLRRVSDGKCLFCRMDAKNRQREKWFAAGLNNKGKLKKGRQIPQARLSPRLIAEAMGLKTYFTGVPCQNGHLAPRRTSDTKCVVCRREKIKSWRKRKRLEWMAQGLTNQGKPRKNRPILPARADAIAEGRTRYIGAPCLRGHDGERWVNNNYCCQCCHLAAAGKKRKHSSSRKKRSKGAVALKALEELGLDLSFDQNNLVPFRFPIEASSRREALEKGARRYFTGKPCKHGHISSRTINAGCDECDRLGIYVKKWRSKDSTRKQKRRQMKRRREKQRIALQALQELGVNIN